MSAFKSISQLLICVRPPLSLFFSTLPGLHLVEGRLLLVLCFFPTGDGYCTLGCVSVKFALYCINTHVHVLFQNSESVSQPEKCLTYFWTVLECVCILLCNLFSCYYLQRHVSNPYVDTLVGVILDSNMCVCVCASRTGP